jgi:hypothetical protein
MKQSGRISLVSLLSVVGIAMIVMVLAFSRESLDSIGARFMSALAKGDAKELAKLTYISGAEPAEIEKMWEESVNGLGKHYRFVWKVNGSTQASPTSGSVRLGVDRNPPNYEENFQLPMIQVDGKWLVDVRGISRQMYPLMPK